MQTMTKIDARARVPALDDAARGRLAGAFDQEGVVAAMVIGSQARGDASQLADVDLAVWLDDEPSGVARRTLRARLHAASATALARLDDLRQFARIVSERVLRG